MRSARPPQDRKFGCPKCEKKFFTPKDLRRHENTHLGLREHVCPSCHTRFGRKDHLTRHAKKSCSAVRNQKSNSSNHTSSNNNHNHNNNHNNNNLYTCGQQSLISERASEQQQQQQQQHAPAYNYEEHEEVWAISLQQEALFESLSPAFKQGLAPMLGTGDFEHRQTQAPKSMDEFAANQQKQQQCDYHQNLLSSQLVADQPHDSNSNASNNRQLHAAHHQEQLGQAAFAGSFYSPAQHDYNCNQQQQQQAQDPLAVNHCSTSDQYAPIAALQQAPHDFGMVPHQSIENHLYHNNTNQSYHSQAGPFFHPLSCDSYASHNQVSTQ